MNGTSQTVTGLTDGRSYGFTVAAHSSGNWTSSPTAPVTATPMSPRPAVTSVSPAKGPVNGRTTVTIRGTNLTGATAVHFGTSAGTTIRVESATQLTVVAPAHAAGVVTVSVTAPGGTSAVVTNDRYTYRI